MANPFGGSKGGVVTDPFSNSDSSAYGGDFDNPFDGPGGNQGGAYGPAGGSRAMVTMTPKAISPSGGLSADDLALREQNLLRREAQLAEKEQFLDQKEAQLAGARILPPLNWPFKCYPILYHSISEEIPPEHRPLVRRFYALCLFTWLCIFWNWLVIMVVWGTSGASDNADGDALWASVFLVLGIPGAWRGWYRSIYYGARDKSSSKWVFFFINFLLHIGFIICMGIGVPGIAGSGLFLMFKLFANDFGMLGILSLVSTAVFGINALSSFYLSKAAHSTWKGEGGEARLKKAVAKGVVEGAADMNAAAADESV